MPPKPIASAGSDTTLHVYLSKTLTFEIKIYTQTRVSCSISLKFSRGNIYAPQTPSNKPPGYTIIISLVSNEHF